MFDLANGASWNKSCSRIWSTLSRGWASVLYMNYITTAGPRAQSGLYKNHVKRRRATVCSHIHEEDYSGHCVCSVFATQHRLLLVLSNKSLMLIKTSNWHSLARLSCTDLFFPIFVEKHRESVNPAASTTARYPHH